MLFDDRRIQHTIDWLEKHLHESISFQHLYEVSHYSPYYFHRRFQETVGMSAARYLRRRRLTTAAWLLARRDMRVLDVALEAQFTSQASFTRAFQQMYGLPPGRYRQLMRPLDPTTEEELSMKEQPKGWFLSGSHPSHYHMGRDREQVHMGTASGYLQSNGEVEPGAFATMMQQCQARPFRNQRIQLSGFVQTKQVEEAAGLWMRIDDDRGEVLQFDNMSNRPITGTGGWNWHAIVLDVPLSGTVLSFGVLLHGTGMIWLDGLAFQEVSSQVPTTQPTMEDTLAAEPINLSFDEEGTEDGEKT